MLIKKMFMLISLSHIYWHWTDTPSITAQKMSPFQHLYKAFNLFMFIIHRTIHSGYLSYRTNEKSEKNLAAAVIENSTTLCKLYLTCAWFHPERQLNIIKPSILAAAALVQLRHLAFKHENRRRKEKRESSTSQFWKKPGSVAGRNRESTKGDESLWNMVVGAFVCVSQ